MKLFKMIALFVAFLLGFCLGGFAIELPTLSAGSMVADHGPSVPSHVETVVNTFYQTNTFTVNPCAATYSLSSLAEKLELRSQEVLAHLSLPTTTISRYRHLRSTITVPRVGTIYIDQPRASFKTLTTRTTTRTTTSFTTNAASATPTTHGNDDLDEYQYEFDNEEYGFAEDENIESSKLELRNLPANSVASTTAICPSDISGEHQFPHLIIPTSIGMPDEPVGNQYMVWISPAASTLFNFDVPATYTGTCALIFLFPFMSELDPSAGKYKYSGMEQVEYQKGGLNFALLGGVADNSTTYKTTPPVAVDYGKTKILPGNQYTVSSFPCPGGKTITIEGSSINKTELDYFQNSASKPIGLFLVPCV